MKISKNIDFKNFKKKKTDKKISKFLNKILEEKNEILKSLGQDYKNSYNKRFISKFKKYSYFNLIGMGGSILGSKAIYYFLKHKIKKTFFFRDYLVENNKERLPRNKLNLIISKSGNTLETIINSNDLLNNNQKNIFITEYRNSYLLNQAKKLKSEIVNHNNFIGGRYSVLSEVGMLPAELMGLNHNKFKRLNELIKKRNFINSLILNVSNILSLVKQKKTNSIILNYDERSSDFLLWYQQLVSESLGKKGKGILPIISNMPKDNHSLMQYYLDGNKNNFYTFFFVKDKSSKRVKNNKLFKSHFFLKNKDMTDITFAKFKASENIFRKKKLPFRSFLISDRNEEILGELFTFFILETILLAKALRVNPYNQPSVELIKNETKKILKNS